MMIKLGSSKIGSLNLRSLVQVLALGVFTFQMYNSMKKYIERPVIQQKSVVRYEKIKKPIIYACQDIQFNHTVAQMYGYDTVEEFVAGYIKHSHIITWKGKNKDKNFKTFKEIFFNIQPNVTFQARTRKEKTVKWMDMEIEKMFVPFDGFCLRLKEVEERMSLSSLVRTYFLFVDPDEENGIRINKIAKGVFEPVTDEYFQYFSYKVNIFLYNSHIHDGKTCTDYTKLNTSFAECYRKSMMKTMFQLYGCIPPWLSGMTNSTCENSTEVKESAVEDIELILDNIQQLLGGQEAKMQDACLPPCSKMTIKLEELMQTNSYKGSAVVDLLINVNEVIVETDIYGYDAFNLIVDLGSALGLWLGLSALSIYDSIIEFYGIFKTKNSKK